MYWHLLHENKEIAGESTLTDLICHKKISPDGFFQNSYLTTSYSRIVENYVKIKGYKKFG